ncbi:peptidylprolyl isomerase, partial [Acinetobacter sp. 163]|nr:peptidylprolyl isomerase [Acinetobacter sp. 163]
MKSLFTLLFFFLTLPALQAQTADTLRHEVLFETTLGKIRVQLYNETPKHRDNFLRLVREGFYDG